MSLPRRMCMFATCQSNRKSCSMRQSSVTSEGYRYSSTFAAGRLFDAVYVINLDRRPDRWEFATQQLSRAGFLHEEYVRFPAVDGRNVDLQKAHACGLISRLGLLRLQEPEHRRIWGMDLNPGAVGCALSHALLWAQIAASRHRSVLVVEDDSLFPQDFHHKYEARAKQVPSDWELLYVSGLDTAGQAPQLRVAEGVCRVPQMHRTTNCYVVSHRGARLLLDACFPVTYQLDTMMTLRTAGDGAGGVPYVTVPNCYTLQPPLVVQATRMGSDIQSASGGVCDRDEVEEERARCRAAGWEVQETGTLVP
ncbi:glycosyl transferase-like protein [Trypanosoma equiperdum]|uniref:Glycosyl transferase-like protein n=2 Tax=Trypanozoon TaxID=39700 RepID=Q383T0_TRYB2|nr:glycosyl transferase [Trypanosoma brucei brucei TREU927]EAN79951.1 glycosyl transferase-like protein [Trypanosoma brucei brucei TREU927]SCU72747.1 glycosyl transferase-like protein [Trypanosoma equiperdum]